MAVRITDSDAVGNDDEILLEDRAVLQSHYPVKANIVHRDAQLHRNLLPGGIGTRVSKGHGLQLVVQVNAVEV